MMLISLVKMSFYGLWAPLRAKPIEHEIDCRSIVSTSIPWNSNGVARMLKSYAHQKRLLYQAMIRYNYVPFHNGNFSYRK